MVDYENGVCKILFIGVNGFVADFVFRKKRRVYLCPC